jgi:hypothetical protein
VGDRHQPRLDVGCRVEVGVRLQRGQECLRPGVLGIRGPEHGAAHAQHGRAVLVDDLLEGFLHVL